MTRQSDTATSGDGSNHYDSRRKSTDRIPAYRNEADIQPYPRQHTPERGVQPMIVRTDSGSNTVSGHNQYEPRSSSVGGMTVQQGAHHQYQQHQQHRQEHLQQEQQPQQHERHSYSGGTLEVIQGAARLDPRTMPMPDELLAKINPQLRMFKLVIVQQPIRARMCGSSDKDWRPVSPPPVLKLVLYDMDGNSVIDNSFMQHLVIHTTLWKDNQEEELTVVELPHNTNSKRISAAAKSRKRGVTQFGSALEPGLELENNLLGDYTASSSIVEDEAGEKGCFFVFPNLSIRLEGRYRLQFTLIKLPSMDDYQQPMVPMCISSVSTDAFDVYSIKTFPGMIESTPLSKALAQQGLKIPIRNTQDNP